jgi:hypothetical protein
MMGNRPISVSRLLAKNDPMKAKKNSGTPRMEIHGEGLGIGSPELVEQRARELALIDGRSEINDDDRRAARDDFQNSELPDAVTEDAPAAPSMTRDPSEPFSDRGRQSPNRGEMDDDTALEKLALEGVEEAQHDQMVASRETIDEPLRSRPKQLP